MARDNSRDSLGSPPYPTQPTLDEEHSTRSQSSATSDSKSLSSVPSLDSHRRRSRFSLRQAFSKRRRRSFAKAQSRLSSIVESASMRWSHFSLFGVDGTHSIPHIWGCRLRSSTTSDHADTRSNTFQYDMRMQLRDERVRLVYYDIFESDVRSFPGKWLIRVFSVGATLLEYFKMFLAGWAFIVSLSVAFFWQVLEPLSDHSQLLVADVIADSLFAFCLALQLRTTMLATQTGKEYCNTRKILHAHLFDMTFWFDAISCIPLVVLDRVAGTRWIALLKALRGWRIWRIPPNHHFVPSNTFLVAQLLCLIYMGGHFCACLWFVIAYEKEETMHNYIPQEVDDFDSWHAQRYQACLERTVSGCFFDFYSIAILNGVYLLMGIDRDAHSAFEHLFVTVCAPIGGLVHACMMGEMFLLIQRRGALDTKQNEHTLAVQEAMRILGLPPNLQMRIIAFFTYERIHRSGRLFDALFAHLSPQLQFELHLHLYLGLICQCKLFRSTRPPVLREIVMKLEDVIYLPGDWVCRYGDYGDSMYFIVSGTCVVIDQDTITELSTLDRGRYFGEVALLTGVPRTAYVRANTFCVMAQLTKDGFAPILRKWPDEIDVLITDIEADSDRQKIKAEASKRYGLRRTSSLGPGASSASTHAESRRGSYLSKAASMEDLESIASPPLLQRGTSFDTIASAKVQGGSSRDSSRSGPLTLKELLGTQNSQAIPSRPSCLLQGHSSTPVSRFSADQERVPSAIRAWVGTSASKVPHPLLSFAEQETRFPRLLGSQNSLGSSSGSEPTCEPGIQTACGDSAAGGTSKAYFPLLPAQQETPDPPGLVSFPDIHHMEVPPPMIVESSEDESEVARHVQLHLSGMSQHVSLLQEEMMKQRSVFMDSLGEMKQWAVEAVKEAVAQELHHFTTASRRTSNASDFEHVLSTPFT